jgi:hypothetical protein
MDIEIPSSLNSSMDQDDGEAVHDASGFLLNVSVNVPPDSPDSQQPYPQARVIIPYSKPFRNSAKSN